jgi:endonuclease-3
MLSSQTKDEVTHAAVQRLIAHGCTPEKIAATEESALEALIYPVGFYRNKAKFLRSAARACVEEWKGDIPPDVPSLCSLKGVGPKMAFIAMSAAWNRPCGIGVDTHVHRIANRLGWVRTTEPEGTREHLEAWMPRDLWGGINVLFVGFGQQICLPAAPRCDECLNRAICPVGTGRKDAASAGKKKDDADW